MASSANGRFIYTPNANFSGVDTFTYRIKDDEPGAVFSDPVTVTINVTAINDKPVAAADPDYEVDEDTHSTVDATAGILANDTDPDTDDTHTIAIVPGTRVTDGTLTLNADGSLLISLTPTSMGRIHSI